MKRWKNYIASSLFFVAFLVSIYGWNRSSHWFEKWDLSFGIGHSTFLSKDSQFILNGRTYPAPSATFEWKFRKAMKLRNRRGKMKFAAGFPSFTSDSGVGSIGHPPPAWNSFQLTGNYWHIALLLLILTTVTFQIERKISQRRLEN